ncbi:MAG: response regulator transcription factor [Chitinophagaceae bacterium]
MQTAQTEKISILLVDDHKLIRDSWSYILNSDSRFRVIGTAGTAEEAVELVNRNNPKIVLMDLNMSPVSGFDITKQILRHSPAPNVIGVSMHTMPVYARKMMQLGAMGYVTKNSSREEMISAIMEVSNGRTYVCDEVKNILAQQELENKHTFPDLNSLTQREIDIVQLIKDGFSSREIAEKLEISLKTVEVHRYNVLKKLSLKNTAALVNFINTYGA